MIRRILVLWSVWSVAFVAGAWWHATRSPGRALTTDHELDGHGDA